MIYSIVHHDRQIEATTTVDLVNLERSLYIGYEAQAQSLILWSEGLIHLFNSIYTYGHFWLIGATAVWLFIRHRDTYKLFRNAIFISGAIGLVAFNVFPLAPPRLLPGDFGAVDTLRLFSSVNYENSGSFVNEYAAIPSLTSPEHAHLPAIACVRSPLVRAWAVLMPLLMSVTVVVTGNHWILDCIAGYVIGVTGLGLAVFARNESWRVRELFASAFRSPAPAA
jgi:membrane-associated phospholipid phosphatase